MPALALPVMHVSTFAFVHEKYKSDVSLLLVLRIGSGVALRGKCGCGRTERSALNSSCAMNLVDGRDPGVRTNCHDSNAHSCCPKVQASHPQTDLMVLDRAPL